MVTPVEKTAVSPALLKPGKPRSGGWGPPLFFSAIICIEYLGLGYLVPVIQTLHLPLIMAVVLFIYLVFRQGVSAIVSRPQTKLFLLFIVMTFLSLSYVYVKTYTFNSLIGQIGYVLLFAIGVFVLDRQSRINYFVVIFVAIHVVLVLINMDVLTSHQRIGTFIAGYFLGDGNDFAWSLTMAIPMSFYMVIKSKRAILKLVWIISCALLIFGVVGTASRGATLGMAASMLFLVIMSRRRAIPIIAMLVVAVGLLIYAPSQYFERMETIQRYTEDSSASGRIFAWKAATKMAIDHPLGVGAGNFNSAYGRYYRAPDAPSMRWISVHSIYFSVLGEFGVIGLITILSILFLNYRDNIRSSHRNATVSNPVKDACVWPLYLNMAVVAYAVCGIFLGGVGYPHLYILSALTVATRVLSEDLDGSPSPVVRQRKASGRDSTSTTPGARIRRWTPVPR